MKLLKRDSDNPIINEMAEKMAENHISCSSITLKNVYKFATRHGFGINSEEAKFIRHNYCYYKYQSIVDYLLNEIDRYKEEKRMGIPLLPDDQQELLYDIKCALKDHENINKYIQENPN